MMLFIKVSVEPEFIRLKKSSRYSSVRARICSAVPMFVNTGAGFTGSVPMYILCAAKISDTSFDAMLRTVSSGALCCIKMSKTVLSAVLAASLSLLRMAFLISASSLNG